MRVTCAVREYVRKEVLAKVAARLKAAEEAAAGASGAYADKVVKARELCEKMCAETQAKFAKEAKKLGLTLITDSYDWNGMVVKDGNRVITVQISPHDFVETVDRDCRAASFHPNAEREEFYRLVDEPKRIRDAANRAADKLLFELELGKVAKGELDNMLTELEVVI